MSENTSVGVIGASGQLGTEFCEIISAAGMDLLPCDKGDPEADFRRALGASVVHWCAPLAALETLDEFPGESTLVLHDSAMSSSLAAAGSLYERLGEMNIGICHWLMNREQVAIVASEATDISEHLSLLGLNPSIMTVAEHDTLMAHSQAPLAVLSRVLLPFLTDPDNGRYLTPSAIDLRAVLLGREEQWTDETMRSILKNPQLDGLLQQLTTVINQSRI
ncbi:MAG: hypothetical protein WDN27_02600 [Candidatus Saccharibacteria bacterium]